MIFISHSSKDKAAALDVQRRLLGYGYDKSQLFLDSDAEMRSDHLDIYEKYSAAVQAPFFQPWRLGPFPPDRIEQVIRQPANRAKLHITDGLVERLKRDTPTTEALPLLAFTLEKNQRQVRPAVGEHRSCARGYVWLLERSQGM